MVNTFPKKQSKQYLPEDRHFGKFILWSLSPIIQIKSNSEHIDRIQSVSRDLSPSAAIRGY